MDLLDRRFLVVVGKGGTGKTTVAAALALRAASRGKRVLLAMSTSRERLSAMLETEFVGDEIVPILARIDAVNMNPDAALEEYGMMILKVRALYKAVMDNKIVKGFLRAIPGIDAWSQLGKALYHVKQMEDGVRKYDVVILDAPATGHALQMLRVPQVIVDVAPPGLLRREAEEGLAILRDPAQTAVVVVTLAEEMPTAETEELVGEMRATLQMPIAALVVNQVLAPLFRDHPVEARKAADVLAEIPEFAPIGAAARTRVVRETIQREMLARLAKLQLPRIELPALAVDRMRRAQVAELAELVTVGTR